MEMTRLNDQRRMWKFIVFGILVWVSKVMFWIMHQQKAWIFKHDWWLWASEPSIPTLTLPHFQTITKFCTDSTCKRRLCRKSLPKLYAPILNRKNCLERSFPNTGISSMWYFLRSTEGIPSIALRNRVSSMYFAVDNFSEYRALDTMLAEAWTA